jgi:hypothetical protein
VGMGQVRQDWHIIKALSSILSHESKKPNSIETVRNDLKSYGCSFMGAPFGFLLAYEPKKSFGSCFISERKTILGLIATKPKWLRKKEVFGLSKNQFFFLGCLKRGIFFNSFSLRNLSLVLSVKFKFSSRILFRNLLARIIFLSFTPFYSLIDSFFLTNSASINSLTMAKCNKLREANVSNFCLPVF